MTAVVLCLMLMVSGCVKPSTNKEEIPLSDTGGEETTFMSYAGPVFPLTLTEDNSAITAQRTITLDFILWTPVWISNEQELEEAKANGATQEELEQHQAYLEEYRPEGGYYQKDHTLYLTDQYTLVNPTQEEQTVELLYPYVSTLRTYRNTKPSMTVDGGQRVPQVFAGSYCGGFQGAEGEGSEGTLNLSQPSRWEDYQAILEDGSYLERALGSFPDFSEIPVVVYRFTDAWGPKESEEHPNPSMQVWFGLDYDKTTVLSYGFHSGNFDREYGRMGRGFSIPEPQEPDYGRPYYLIVLGEDIQNLQTQGYATGGWDTEEKVASGVVVDRYEVSLDDALRDAARMIFYDYVEQEMLHAQDFELYYGLLCDDLVNYGVLSETTMERYDTGWLEEHDVLVEDRIFYLSQEITIPAEGVADVSFYQGKQPSFDYLFQGKEHRGLYGYDLVTKLGSNLQFTQQVARLEPRDQIELVGQNFGFDLAQEQLDVQFDVEQEHYYLEVRAAEDT